MCCVVSDDGRGSSTLGRQAPYDAGMTTSAEIDSEGEQGDQRVQQL